MIKIRDHLVQRGGGCDAIFSDGCLGVGGGSVGLSAGLQHASVEGRGFESHCSPSSTGDWLAPRCAPTCLQTESKLAQILRPRH